MAVRSEIRAIIQNALGFGTDTQSVAAQDYAISATLADIASERQWTWLTTVATGTLTAGSEDITEPTDLVAPKQFKIKTTSSAYWPLQKVSADDIEASLWTTSAPTPAERGVPDRWAWIRREIKIYPRPDLAYSYELVYVKEPTLDYDGTFTAGETVWFTPDQFHHLIAWGAARYLAMRKRDFAFYDRLSAEYQRLKTQLEQYDRSGTESGYVEDWDGWRALSGPNGYGL